MAFLKLNGVTIPTAKGGKYSTLEVGQRQRAFDGTYLRDVRAFKRQWKFRTRPISELRAASLIGLIKGAGVYFPWDVPAGTATVYGSNGLASSPSVINGRTAYAADGYSVLDENGVSESHAGYWSVCGEHAATAPNKVTAAMATCSATTSMTGQNGATLVIGGLRYLVGTESLKVLGDGATANPYVTMTALASGAFSTTYTVSCYVTSLTVTSNAFIVLKDTANAVTGTGSSVALSTSWRRHTVSITTPGSGSTPVIALEVHGTLGTDILYVDCIQLEINSAGSFPTTWIAPSSNRSATSLTYTNPSYFDGGEGITLNLWMTKPYTVAANQIVAEVYTGNDYCGLYVPTSTPTTMRFYTGHTGSTSNLDKTSLTYTGWHMVTAVMRHNPETGETFKTLYFDGVSVGTSSSTDGFITFPGFTTLAVANEVTTSPCYNRIDDVQVLPYPVDSTAVAGWFANGTTTPGLLPLLIASGDFAADSTVTVQGQIDDVSYVGYYDSPAGTWRANGRVIEFTLEEI